MDRQSETEREARLRAVQAMQDDLYKRTADSRGEMLRASRRSFTDSPERGMSADGQAAASDARMLAGDLVRGSSDGAREMLGVAPPAAAAPAPVAKMSAPAVKVAPDGPSAKGKGPAMDARARIMQGRQASADAEYKRRAMERPVDREAIADDLADRRDAGLLSDEATMRALESMRNNDSRERIMRDLNERRAAGLLGDDEYRRIVESVSR